MEHEKTIAALEKRILRLESMVTEDAYNNTYTADQLTGFINQLFGFIGAKPDAEKSLDPQFKISPSLDEKLAVFRPIKDSYSKTELEPDVKRFQEMMSRVEYKTFFWNLPNPSPGRDVGSVANLMRFEFVARCLNMYKFNLKYPGSFSAPDGTDSNDFVELKIDKKLFPDRFENCTEFIHAIGPLETTDGKMVYPRMYFKDGWVRLQVPKNLKYSTHPSYENVIFIEYQT